MFAVIKTGGKQYKVQEGDVLNVEKLKMEKDNKVAFDKVLLIEDEGKTLIGTPFVENALVRAEVIENLKDKKVIVFKKKRRKQYRRTRGHRQELTRIKIEEIVHGIKAVSRIKPAKAVKEEKKKVAPKKELPKVAEKKEVKPVPKKRVAVSKPQPPKPKEERPKKAVKKEAEKKELKPSRKARVLKAGKSGSKASSGKKAKAKTAAKTKKIALKKEK